MSRIRSKFDGIESSRLSTASSDSDSSIGSRTSSTTNLDKYLTSRSNRNQKYVYTKRARHSLRPGSRSDLGSRISQYHNIVSGGKDPDGFPPKKKEEECLKCLLKLKHTKCESHKYIRIGGGYRHGYYYVKMLLEKLELQRLRDEMLKKRLEGISEGNSRAIKTYIRTKSGRLIEKIIYMSEEDYKKFMDAIARGEDPSKILANYLDKDEMKNLESYDKDEQVAVKTYVRTKSGRLIEKIIYMSKSEFDAMQRGDIDANELLRKKLGLKSGEKLEGWQESKMRMITTKIRTKSGRIIEKQIMISEEDYQKLMKGGDLNEILNKYMKNDPNAKIMGWDKAKKPGMKVVKTWVRTKSGRLIEKTIMMTEEEYAEFLKSGGDPNFLKKYLDLKEGETIDKWEKQSTVYDGSDDEQLKKAKPGQRYVDKDGNEYEVVVDPLTGKKYKKLIKKGDKNELSFRTKDGRVITEKDIKKRKELKQGKRNPDSSSEYSYKSFVSAGGTRHVRRKKKNADGTYGDSESYHSSQDEAGQARRRKRRRDRKHGGDSAHSYYSVVSAGGTRHVRRRKRNADGTYGDSESYHSADSAMFAEAEKAIKKQKEKMGKGSADSDHSYFSEVSAGGTRHKMKRKRIRDEHGNVIGYGKALEHDGTGKALNKGKGKKGRDHGADSEHSYYSEVSAGGTRYRKRRKRIKDKDGNVIGYGDDEDYSSSDEKKKKKKRGGPDSAYSYYSEVSAGGTKHTMKRKRIRDEHGNVIGYDKPVEASSSEESFITVSDGKGGKMRVANPKKKKKYSQVFSDATTDSDIVRQRLANMTEEEKVKYLKERAERAAERDKKRREKYGDKYEEMMKDYTKKKEDYKNKVKGRRGTILDSTTKAAALKEKKLREGFDADSESEYDPITGKKKKKGQRKGSGDSSSSVEVIRDKDGKIIKKIRRDKDGNLIVEEYDKDGNLISRKKKGKDDKENDNDSDAGSYFERDEHGNLVLKKGLKKIDLKNLTREQLLALGIDPNLSKAEQMRLLKQMFGDDIDIVFGKKKIGTKDVNDYGSDANTSDLANDSDIDIDTAKPGKRERIITKRLGSKLQDHMKLLIEQSMLKDFQPSDEKASKIDFLSAYRLVDPNNIQPYAKFFAIEDHDDLDGIVTHKGCVTALNNLKRTGIIKNLTDKQMDFVLAALDIGKYTEVSFRMFAVVAALGDRMTKLDSYCRDLLEISNLLDIERKMKFYRDLFYMNIRSDLNTNFIKVDSIIIDMRAGGLNKDQQDFIVDKLHPNEMQEISFIDFLSFIPLFISCHDNINSNPLNMSDSKYTPQSRRKASIQRDMNPLGYPMTKQTKFFQQHYMPHMHSRNVSSLTENNPDLNVIGKSKRKMSRFSPLPEISNSRREH